MYALPSLQLNIVAKLRAAGCVYAEDEARLLVSCAASADDLSAMVDRRVTGLPLEQVVGWAEFYGLRITLAPGVFVPRRRTEFMVAQAAARVPRSRPSPPVIVDLCCGSGAIGAALRAALGHIELHAADIEPAAVRCARTNLPDAAVYQGDLYEPLPPSLRGKVTIIAANAPYVPTEALELLPPEARDYEPLVALDGGADGLDILRRVAAMAPRWLAPGGHLFIETSSRQAPRAAEAFAQAGLIARVAASEEYSATVVIGQLPSEPSRPPSAHLSPAAAD